ncbi:MAG: hypothetical protein QW194_04755 [Candidatus Micrarchaeaceae archaeon]
MGQKECAKAIENRPHLEELELTMNIYGRSKERRVLLDGGSGKKAIIPAALAPYLRKSVDIDVIMKGADAKAMLGCIRYRNMTDRVVYRNDAVYSLLSPFEVVDNIENIDIFTEQTGVGPIPVSGEVFDRSYSVYIGKARLWVKLPEISFVAATSMNPIVQKKGRIVPTLIAMLGGMHGSDVSDAMVKSVEYMLDGSERVHEKLGDASRRNAHCRHILHDPNYTEYDRKISEKLPNVIDNNRRVVLHLSRRMGIDRNEADRFLERYKLELRRA